MIRVWCWQTSDQHLIFSLQLSNSTSWDLERPDLPIPAPAPRIRSGSVPGAVVRDNGSTNYHILNRLREASREYENYSKSDAMFLRHSKSEDATYFSKSDADIATVIRYKPTDKDTTTSSSEMLSWRLTAWSDTVVGLIHQKILTFPLHVLRIVQERPLVMTFL